MIEALVTLTAGVGGYLLARNFVSHRLRSLALRNGSRFCQPGLPVDWRYFSSWIRSTPSTAPIRPSRPPTPTAMRIA